jgi:hypothetical protein
MTQMTESLLVAAPPAPAEAERLKYVGHAIVGVAIGFVAVFTLFAWIPAMLIGSVIGQERVEQAHAIRAGRSLTVVRVLAVIGGAGAMLYMGAIVGGLVAFVIVFLTASSERLAVNVTPNDRSIARILVGLLAAVVWFALIYVLQIDLSVRLGG